MKSKCSNCNKQFDIQREWIGQQTTCPYCQKQVTVQPLPIVLTPPSETTTPSPSIPSANVCKDGPNAATLSPLDCIVQMFKNCTNFSGRASRKEFWWPFLFLLILKIVVKKTLPQIPMLMYGVVILLPWAALGFRRLHDRNYSGFVIIGFYICAGLFSCFDSLGLDTPCIVSSWVGVFFIVSFFVVSSFPGIKGPNRFGVDPYER